MAKFTDVVRNDLIAYFQTGDQPTQAQFTELITRIQEGIEEHQHDGTGDGDGTGDLVGPITLAGNSWIGIGAAVERIVFDVGGFITVQGAKFGVGLTSPTYQIVAGGVASPIIQILSTDLTGTSSVFFGDPGGAAPGRIVYDHNTNELALWVNGVEQLTISSAGVVKIVDLAGVGARNVVAAADGTLSAP